MINIKKLYHCHEIKSSSLFTEVIATSVKIAEHVNDRRPIWRRKGQDLMPVQSAIKIFNREDEIKCHV